MFEIVKFIENLGLSSELIQSGNPELGSDVAVPCFGLAKELKKPPQEIAEGFASKIDHPQIEKAEAISGYLNIWFNDGHLFELASNSTESNQEHKDKVIVCEYGDPNPLKVLHAGHLYTGIVGDAIANLYEYAGGEVHRVNFGGDVGLHIGRAMWAIFRAIDNDPAKLSTIPKEQRQDWLSARYVEGNAAYTNNEAAQQEIKEVNKDIYRVHRENDKESAIAKAYWICRQWSYDYFDEFYARLGVEFEKYYPESEGAELGLQIIKEQLEKGVYKESDGAIIFEGESHGLHTRVFVNSEGLPTYETKDVGLIFNKWRDYEFDESVMITGSDQLEYMKVVQKSIEQYEPKLVERTKHLTHGIVKLSGGVKMSSRLGNFLKAVDILDTAAEAAAEQSKDNPGVVIAAVKYAFLKHTIGSDIHYDPEESVSTTGNSGPYLQYAHARACGIVNKSTVSPQIPVSLDEGERILVRKIADFNQVLEEATAALAPNRICNYLFELTQTFNRFYEGNRVIESDREAQRIAILDSYKKVLSTGLGLLGIEAPERV